MSIKDSLRQWFSKKAQLIPKERQEFSIELAQQASMLLSNPFWPHILALMAEQRVAALGALMQPKDQYSDSLALASWRTTQILTSMIERYPESVIEFSKERSQWQNKQQ